MLLYPLKISTYTHYEFKALAIIKNMCKLLNIISID